MAEEIDLRFLGEQMKRLQSDVRQLKSDMAQGRAETVRVESELVSIRADLTTLRGELEAFKESVSDRFDQQTELLKSSFRTLSLEIQSLKKS